MSKTAFEPLFIQGLVYGLATLNRNHDQPTMCAEVLIAAGVTCWRDILGYRIPEYDLEGIRSAMLEVIRRHEQARKERQKRIDAASAGAMAAHTGQTTAK